MNEYDILEVTEEGVLLLNKERANQETEAWFNIFELSELSECGPMCAFCGNHMAVANDTQRAYDEELIFRVSLKYCRNCRNWVWNCYDWQSYDIVHLSDGCPPGPLEATAWSKLANFSKDLPEGVEPDIAQAFRQDARRWHQVAPPYLERFLTAAFRATGEYCEAKHVGRPGDGGVDIVLVDGESKKWLVSVKRRGTLKKAEPISTLRDIIGAMVLEGSRHAIVATTAGRFSAPANNAKVTALQQGFQINLMNREALDRLIGSLLPDDSWVESLSQFSKKAVKRIYRELPSDRQLRLF